MAMAVGEAQARVSGVYAIVRDDGLCYVGSSRNISARWRGHQRALREGAHHSPYLQRSWNGHGPDAHKLVVLEVVEPKREQLIAREQHYIDNLNSAFNCARTAGSRLGVPQPREAVEKVAACNRGKVRTPEVLVKMSAWQKGKPKPSSRRPKCREWRSKIAAANRGKTFSPETRQKMSAWQVGRTLPQSTRDKIAAAHLGKKRSLETRLRIAEANRRRVVTAETRAKISAIKRAAAAAREATTKERSHGDCSLS